jgi:Holliday junction resolvase
MSRRKNQMNAKQKGARGERELAKYLIDKGYESKRGQQFSGGPESPDVISSLPLHIECKRVEKLNIDKAYEQSLKDSEGKKPASVIFRKNRGKWMICLSLDDFLELI